MIANVMQNKENYWGLNEMEWYIKINEISRKKAEMIDRFVASQIPAWKWNLLKKYKSRILAKLLNVNVDMEYRQCLDKFGDELIVRVGKKYLAIYIAYEDTKVRIKGITNIK